jgi:hypothetical protein
VEIITHYGPLRGTKGNHVAGNNLMSGLGGYKLNLCVCNFLPGYVAFLKNKWSQPYYCLSVNFPGHGREAHLFKRFF